MQTSLVSRRLHPSPEQIAGKDEIDKQKDQIARQARKLARRSRESLLFQEFGNGSALVVFWRGRVSLKWESWQWKLWNVVQNCGMYACVAELLGIRCSDDLVW